MRLFRTIFFLGVIAILIPSPPEESGQGFLRSSPSEITAPQVIYAASRTASDVGAFCGRQPMVCETAGFVASRLEAKAKYGARLIYEWANEASRPPGADQAFDARLSTASLPKVAVRGARESQNTLTMDDLIPEWRDPLKARKG